MLPILQNYPEHVCHKFPDASRTIEPYYPIRSAALRQGHKHHLRPPGHPHPLGEVACRRHLHRQSSIILPTAVLVEVVGRPLWEILAWHSIPIFLISREDIMLNQPRKCTVVEMILKRVEKRFSCLKLKEGEGKKAWWHWWQSLRITSKLVKSSLRVLRKYARPF